MSDTTTLARPYARAVFELAAAQEALPRWGEALEALAGVIASPSVQPLLASPRVSAAQIGEAIIDAAGDGLDEHGRNLVRLLAENRRLGLLPDIAAGFDALRAEAEKVVDVEVRSATEPGEAFRQRLVEALRQRLGRDVNVTYVTDPEVIGGAVIRAGDLIIDGSLRGRLEKLAASLSA